MWTSALTSAVAAATLLLCTRRATAQSSCPNALKASYPAPVVASGWTAQIVAQGLSSPRGIIFDGSGALLVVEQQKGIRRLRFASAGGGDGACLSVADSQVVVANAALNHGIALSADGRTLYASSADEVLAWGYDSSAGNVTTSTARTLVNGMGGTDHVTRTLLVPARQPGLLLVSRGSGDNVDDRARNVSSGVSQIRAFNLTNLTATTTTTYDYASAGVRLGWGLRNSVGVAEHPTTGGIFSVENSVDQLSRGATDVHEDNPGEELNFHGFLNGTTASSLDGGGGNNNNNNNYGYPDCFALWDTNIPDRGALVLGSQFTPTQSPTLNDTTCAQDRVPPRLTFQAHTAPLDIKFTPDGQKAYLSFHGSWDRTAPTGYKLASLAFSNTTGQPLDPSTSSTSLSDILTNPDNSRCPAACFRPAGIALDPRGRVYMTSDATGEIYVLTSTASSPSSSSSTSASPSATGTSPAPASTTTTSSVASSPLGRLSGSDATRGLAVAVAACLLTATGIGGLGLEIIIRGVTRMLL